MADRPGTDLVSVNRIFHDHECGYYDERFAIRHDARSARAAEREIERLLGRRLSADDVVLDLGCGTGWFAAGLRRGHRGVHAVGVDVSAGMLDRARAAGAWPLLQADATRLPLRDGSVDVVAARGVLHHLPDVDAALGECRRVLCPGGAVVVAAEPTEAVETHGGWLLRALLPLLRRPLSAEENFWEVAAMAANLHVFDAGAVAAAARSAGFRQARLTTSGLLETLLLTTSYVVHGRRPGLARWLPWRPALTAAAGLDRLVTDRLVPARHRHTVVGVLQA